MPDDKLKKLYDNVHTEYELPDYNTFKNDMNDETKRQKFYSAIHSNYELPDYDTFSSDMGFVKKKSSPQPSSSVATPPTKPSVTTPSSYQWSSGNNNQTPTFKTPIVSTTKTITPTKQQSKVAEKALTLEETTLNATKHDVITKSITTENQLKNKQIIENIALSMSQNLLPANDEATTIQYQKQQEELQTKHANEAQLTEEEKQKSVDNYWVKEQAKTISSNLNLAKTANDNISKMQAEANLLENRLKDVNNFPSIEQWEQAKDHLESINQQITQANSNIFTYQTIATRDYANLFAHTVNLQSGIQSLEQKFLSGDNVTETDKARYNELTNAYNSYKYISDIYENVFAPKQTKQNFADTGFKRAQAIAASFNDASGDVINIVPNVANFLEYQIHNIITEDNPNADVIKAAKAYDEKLAKIFHFNIDEIYKPEFKGSFAKLGDVLIKEPAHVKDAPIANDPFTQLGQGIVSIAPQIAVLYATGTIGNLYGGVAGAEADLASLMNVPTTNSFAFTQLATVTNTAKSLGEAVDKQKPLALSLEDAGEEFVKTALVTACFEGIGGVAGKIESNVVNSSLKAMSEKYGDLVYSSSGTILKAKTLGFSAKLGTEILGFSGVGAAEELITTGKVTTNNLYQSAGMAIVFSAGGAFGLAKQLGKNAIIGVSAADSGTIKAVIETLKKDGTTIEELIKMESDLSMQADIYLTKGQTAKAQPIIMAIQQLQTVRNIKMGAEMYKNNPKVVSDAILNQEYATPEIKAEQEAKIKIFEENAKEVPTETPPKGEKETEQPKPLQELESIPFEQRTPVEHSDFIKQKFVQEFTKMGVPEEQVHGAIALMDARAKSWASEEVGRTPEEYYKQIADVKNGEFETETPRLYQMPDGTQVMGMKSSPEVVNGFYSNIEKSLLEIKNDKMPAKQWSDKLTGEEAEWTGLKEWLSKQEGSVTKQQIQDYLKNNRVEIVEVVKGGEDPIEFQKNTSVDTKYSNYQTEGQKERYKEILIVLPSKGNLKERWGVFDNKGKFISSYNSEIKAKQKSESIGGTYRMADNVGDADPRVNFQTSHFSEPNILVHLRMNTRIDAEGKKVLFLEEIQSDWGQKGKKEGFKEKPKELPKDFVIKPHKLHSGVGVPRDGFMVIGGDGLMKGSGTTIEEATNNALDRLTTQGQPTAPFVTNTNSWTKLGLKVALKEAVKQGADRIAWTTGEQQNSRYDLSKQINSIEWNRYSKKDGTFEYELGIKYKDKKPAYMSVEESKLSDYIGKEMSEKIIKDKSEEGKLSNLDLQVGGKGMKGFYGSPTEGKLGIVGEVAKKLFKQEPKTTEITTREDLFNEGKIYEAYDSNGKLIKRGTSENYIKIIAEQNNGTYKLVDAKQKITQHSVEITPELRKSVEEGLPLFQKEQGKPKGALETLQDGRKVIHAFDGADFSTTVHEVVHIFEKDINPTEAATFEKYSKTKQGTTEYSEAFARAGERYIRNGESPLPELKPLFEKFKTWMKNIYSSLKGSPIEKKINPEVKQIFDRLLTEKPKENVQEPSAAQEVPPIGEAGKVKPQDSNGVGQGKQGNEVAKENNPKKEIVYNEALSDVKEVKESFKEAVEQDYSNKMVFDTENIPSSVKRSEWDNIQKEVKDAMDNGERFSKAVDDALKNFKESEEFKNIKVEGVEETAKGYKEQLKSLKDGMIRDIRNSFEKSFNDHYNAEFTKAVKENLSDNKKLSDQVLSDFRNIKKKLETAKKNTETGKAAKKALEQTNKEVIRALNGIKGYATGKDLEKVVKILKEVNSGNIDFADAMERATGLADASAKNHFLDKLNKEVSKKGVVDVQSKAFYDNIKREFQDGGILDKYSKAISENNTDAIDNLKIDVSKKFDSLYERLNSVAEDVNGKEISKLSDIERSKLESEIVSLENIKGLLNTDYEGISDISKDIINSHKAAIKIFKDSMNAKRQKIIDTKNKIIDQTGVELKPKMDKAGELQKKSWIGRKFEKTEPTPKNNTGLFSQFNDNWLNIASKLSYRTTEAFKGEMFKLHKELIVNKVGEKIISDEVAKEEFKEMNKGWDRLTSAQVKYKTGIKVKKKTATMKDLTTVRKLKEELETLDSESITDYQNKYYDIEAKRKEELDNMSNPNMTEKINEKYDNEFYDLNENHTPVLDQFIPSMNAEGLAKRYFNEKRQGGSEFTKKVEELIEKKDVMMEIPASVNSGITLYNYWKSPGGRMAMENSGFSAESITQIEKFIGEKGVKRADKLLKWYEKQYEIYNKKHVELFGTEIPKEEFYSSLVIDTSNGTKVNLDKSGNISILSKNLISRVDHSKMIDPNIDAFQNAKNYKQSMDNWYYFQEFVDNMNALNSSARFKASADKIQNGLYGNLHWLAKEMVGVENGVSGKTDIMVKASDIASVSILFLKSLSSTKQLVDIPKWGQMMEVGNEARFLYDIGKNLSYGMVSGKTLKYAAKLWKENPHFRERVRAESGGNDSVDRLFADISNGKILPASLKKLQKILIKAGLSEFTAMDSLAIVVGSQPYYEQQLRYYTKAGQGDKAAKLAMDDVGWAMGVVNASTTKGYKGVGQMKSNWGKMASSFMSAPLTGIRLQLSAARNIKGSVISEYKKQGETKNLSPIEQKVMALSGLGSKQGIKGIRDLTLINVIEGGVISLITNATMMGWDTLTDDEKDKKLKVLASDVILNYPESFPIIGNPISRTVHGVINNLNSDEDINENLKNFGKQAQKDLRNGEIFDIVLYKAINKTVYNTMDALKKNGMSDALAKAVAIEAFKWTGTNPETVIDIYSGFKGLMDGTLSNEQARKKIFQLPNSITPKEKESTSGGKVKRPQRPKRPTRPSR